MYDLIITIFLFACVGLVALPTIVLLLARFGYFEPISFTVFGAKWHFAQKVRVVTTMGRGTGAYKQDSWVMVGAVSTALIVFPADYFRISLDRSLQVGKTQTLSRASGV
jgi:hypothetical protein